MLSQESLSHGPGESGVTEAVSAVCRMGMLQQDVTNAVMATEAAHTVLAAHLPVRGGSW